MKRIAFIDIADDSTVYINVGGSYTIITKDSRKFLRGYLGDIADAIERIWGAEDETRDE
jgi:hypothetical protein